MDEHDVGPLELQDIEFDSTSLGGRQATAFPGSVRWGLVAKSLPTEVRDLIEEKVRQPGYRLDVIERVEPHIGVNRHTQDVLHVEQRWRRAVRSPSRRDHTLGIVRKMIDEVLWADHVGRLVTRRPIRKLPRNLRNPVVQDGVLTVDDPKKTKGALFLRSFPEVTPPAIYTHTTRFQRRRLRSLGHRAGIIFPLAWDLTAGSGTGLEIVKALGGRMVASDLSANYPGMVTLDARNMGTCAHHQFPFLRTSDRVNAFQSLSEETISIAHPQVVFIDPPSRGTPTHAERYGCAHPQLDLALLDRTQWISDVAYVVLMSLHHVSKHGIVSLVVREGVRNQSEVTPDPTLGPDLMAVLGSHVQILDHVKIEYGHTAKQTSLSSKRMPMRHYILGRPS